MVHAAATQAAAEFDTLEGRVPESHGVDAAALFDERPDDGLARYVTMGSAYTSKPSSRSAVV